MGHEARRRRLHRELEQIQLGHLRLGASFAQVVATLGQQAGDTLTVTETAVAMAGALLDRVEAGAPVSPEECRALRAGLIELQAAVDQARRQLERQARTGRLGLDY